MRELGVGEIATIVGRYYAMDRDNRWERVKLAYRRAGARCRGEEEQRSGCSAAVKLRTGGDRRIYQASSHYQRAGPAAEPVGLIRDDDAVIFYNFRADRARQMTFALAAPDFDKFVDEKRPKNLFYVAMTKYDKNWPWLQCCDHAGKAGAHPGAGVSGTAVQEFAVRGDGEIRARDLLL